MDSIGVVVNAYRIPTPGNYSLKVILCQEDVLVRLTSVKEKAIDQLILQITLLQQDINFTKQRSLMPFFEDSEEDF
ncbi:MAG: hypothetical protein ACFFC7_29730 [Candidatus Hermodarchaeota archaeon]